MTEHKCEARATADGTFVLTAEKGTNTPDFRFNSIDIEDDFECSCGETFESKVDAAKHVEEMSDE